MIVDGNKQRLLVLTDIGGDPDDEQSLVRLLIYANEFDIEGIITEFWAGNEHSGRGRTPESQMEVVFNILKAYKQVLPNLLKHASGYPSYDELFEVVKRGFINVPFTNDTDEVVDVFNIIGEGRDTEGSEWLIRVVDKLDTRPLNIAVWGGTADLAQALWKVQLQRSEVELKQFLSKIRVHCIGKQDDTVEWICKKFPDLFFILNHARDGVKWNSCFRGMFFGGDETLTSMDWVTRYVTTDRGALGEMYPNKTYTGKNPFSCLKEGDTPSWFYFYKNGLNTPEHPEYGGWGGRYLLNGTFFQDGEDCVNGETSARAAVWRWRQTFQNDFQARMEWCVKTFEDANHNPIAVVNEDDSKNEIYIHAVPGEKVKLSASGSYDPDGDRLSYSWWVYREAGTYGKDVEFENSMNHAVLVKVPEDAAGKTIHVILEVTDNKLPSLTSYRRVVIEI